MNSVSYASPDAPLFGSLGIQQTDMVKSGWSKVNQANAAAGPTPSGVPADVASFAPAFVVPSMLDKGTPGVPRQPGQPPAQPPAQRPGQPPAQRPGQPPAQPGAGGPIKLSNPPGKHQVHMVYGAWCGHSKRALPAFQELVKMTDVTTSSGQPIEFVLTEDTNKALVKEMQVRGFPTYKYVLPDGTVKPFNAGNRSKEAILESAKKL